MSTNWYNNYKMFERLRESFQVKRLRNADREDIFLVL